MEKFYNIVSPDIVSYRRYKVLGEYTSLEDALDAYSQDVAEWKQKHRGELYAYATVGIEGDL